MVYEEDEFTVDAVIPVHELETLLVMAVGFAVFPTDDGTERRVVSLVNIIEKRAYMIGERHRNLLGQMIVNGRRDDLTPDWARALRALEARPS